MVKARRLPGLLNAYSLIVRGGAKLNCQAYLIRSKLFSAFWGLTRFSADRPLRDLLALRKMNSSHRQQVRSTFGREWRHFLAGLGSVAALLAAGCASPGHPLPPSLKIPRPATGLVADRVGDEVHLHWTTPGRTTDGVQLPGAGLVAQICRRLGPQTPAPRQQPAGAGTAATSCPVVSEMPVRPGPSEAVDRLPPAIVNGPPALLQYAVILLGPTRKTAGPSAPAFTAAGQAPEAIADFRASDSPEGALLQWTPEDPATKDDTVRLERRTMQAQAPGSAAPARTNGTGPVTNLTAGEGDAGGVVDRTAEIGQTYTYTAQRVRNTTLDGRDVTLWGPSAGPVTVAMKDTFPPSAPSGLVAAPGPGSIDLSWEPVEVRAKGERLAGYRVYRRADGDTAWTGLSEQLVPEPAFRDRSVQPGGSYRYRVTAVNAAGNESAPSAEATATAIQP